MSAAREFSRVLFRSYEHTAPPAGVWAPAPDAAPRVDAPSHNLFCSGYIQLADGRVLVAGGNEGSLNGIVQTHLFDWRTQSWSRGPDMTAGRWYASVIALANGEAVIGDRKSTSLDSNNANNSYSGFFLKKKNII